MKIIEKKCPNCGANLKFNAGDHDVHCEKCRRDFAIEYDDKMLDPEVALRAKDIQLRILDDFEKKQKFVKIFFIIVILIIIASIIGTVVGMVSQEAARKEREKRQQEEIEQMWQDQQDYSDGEFDMMNEEIQRQMEEIQRQMQENNFSGAGV